jgi:O-antigen ligase
MLLSGSRYLSHWLGLSNAADAMDVYMEGSPIDRTVFLALMVSALVVLGRRPTAWGVVLRQNWWVWGYFLFGAASITWSEYPEVSLRRLVKAIGNVIMVLVVLSEPKPYEAIGLVLRRLGFVLLPLSVLLIKYYPAMGRGYHPGSWETMYTGVSTQKNGLGQLCLLAGLYMCWAIIFQVVHGGVKSDRVRIVVYLSFLGMSAWLLYMADSATSIVCLSLAIGALCVARLPAVSRRPHRIMTCGAAAAALVMIGSYVFDVYGFAVGVVGRDTTLTTRVPMWQGLADMAGDPIVGFGYESFWLGDRLRSLWDEYGRLNQAHNGYLEVYLNLGLVGLALLGMAVVVGFRRISRALWTDYSAAVLRLCLLTVVVVYNWTEATFYGTSNMWFVFLCAVIEIPKGGAKVRERGRMAGEALARR